MEFVTFINGQELSPFARMKVMYIEKVPNRNYPPAVLRPDSYQEGNQVKKRTLANSLAELAEPPLKITR
ncbi:MAG: hypothetical protein EWV53_14615 [Microcystis panniformis Mp_MB_F_20051200_S9]|uniref:Uncharacterized protein n=1 Tax=Microcystis panniformis Mp_MB_F_20051200_S9 TaxID=2486223 RepID=A0A552PU54_9CHRO|nr:MAG: hypothetical protein EWV42_20370 [Microcystis panniformis Mp_GB_SS_20050300_S99D]TRV52287.1 MAG: hypothetical protein EWV43_02580 [Microcystis panniformis Mp_MB_F_20080800_S26D]TRV54098.1 MAG: hypothetical protein EWV87_01415 [Microcystis panniformis Mp_GB_SS_20050300_S99]TRV59336.1 MAG: hypothetical protein EWV69_12065 [Microcystis panniformis Mp_MB_F_20080800_S26]TRV60426.1 MAG: hypothetical protein EWV53_14615 [Microcystis panniformis Mp_MB_F_20051200_S9]TRV60640.1 MAG: hypothetical